MYTYFRFAESTTAILKDEWCKGKELDNRFRINSSTPPVYFVDKFQAV